MDRPTFSPIWHRVRALHPRLRPHVDITRQRYRGRRWYVAHDPSSNQFYRLSPVAYDLVMSLDGRRTVEEAWTLSLQKFGDGAPTQNEVVELLGQLYSTNLLSVDSTPEVEQFLQRGRERVKRRLTQQAIGLMYFRLRLFNPEPILRFLVPILKPVLNRWGLLVWAIAVGAALVSILPEWPRLVGGFDQYVSPANSGWMLTMFVLLKLIHELGHGITCKRLGGQVPEFGVMLLVLIPSPYVDASSCWAFPSKWQRMAVGAGGMIFEIGCAAIAAFVWLASPDGSLAKQLAYFAMLTASVSTILFNINPLMKFDGYYMLADWLEIPNLMQRSQQMLHYLAQKYAYAVERPRLPSTLPGEQATLVIFGVLAMVYRVVLFLSITLFVVGQFFVVGLFLALWSTAAWFLLPAGKFIHWLASDSALVDRRARAIGVSLAAIAGLALLVGAVPVPDWRRGSGVVESVQQAGVYFRVDGFVDQVFVRPGSVVKEGDVLAQLSSPELVRARRTLKSQVDEYRVLREEARSKDKPAEVDMGDQALVLLRDQLDEIDLRIEALTVRAPQAGTIVGPSPQQMVGAFVRRGEPLCLLVDAGRLRVAATLGQNDAAWFNELDRSQYRVQMRTSSNVTRIVEGGAIWSVEAGQRTLPHAALGFVGGGQIETMQEDQQGRSTKKPVFTVYVEPAEGEVEGAALGLPGERVYLRFTLPSRPLLGQVVDRLQKALQGKVNL